MKEQFVIGVVLESTRCLIESKDWVIHYWGSKEEWNLKINLWFSKINICETEALTAAAQLDISEWRKTPINRAKTSLGKRLIKWSHKYCPDKVSVN